MMRRGAIPLVSLLLLLGCEKKSAVTFGAVLPLTGSAQIYGESVKLGIELAFDELGQDPDQQQFELEVVDSQSEPDRAREELDRLYAAGAVGVIGGVTTVEALEMVPVADEYDRVLVSPSASSPELTAISKNFYRVFPSDFLEGTKMGTFAAQTLQLETAVILAAEGPYAVGVQQVFKSEFERHGGEVLEIIEFPENTSDFSGLLERVMTLKPSAVYLAAFAKEIGAMIKGLRERGFEGTILTTSAFSASQAMERVGEDATGVFLTQTVFEPAEDNPKVQEFIEAFEGKFGSAPDIYAAHGYDAVMVMVEALDQQGVRTASDLWKGMRSIRAFPGVTGSIQFDEKGDVQKFPRVYRIGSDGVLENYESEVERRRKEILQRLRQLQDEQRKRVREQQR